MLPPGAELFWLTQHQFTCTSSCHTQFMRSRVLLMCSAMLVLLAACTSVDGAVTFESFTSNGNEYEFGTSANFQGTDEPCVTVTEAFTGGIASVFTCPTEPSDGSGYAAILDLRRTVFVVGFGLQEGESIVLPDAIRVLDTDSVDGRRFFLIQLAEQASSESFEVPITNPDGTVRFITAEAQQ